MCWRIDKLAYCRDSKKYHKIADKDLYVYKYGKASKEDNCFHPYFKGHFSYKPNVLNEEVKLFLASLHSIYTIDEGYHSYDNSCIESFYLSASHIGKFIIPEGTEYYINDDGEIVSSQIMWTGEYEENNF